jgi:sarcosine oxidase
VVVIGAGAMGLATARALARSGRSVLVLEQFELGHTRGSSHGTSRIFRFAYEDPEFVAMAKAALPLWRELEQESGEELLRHTGALDVGGDLARLHDALATNGVTAEWLDQDGLSRRFPRLHLPDDEALFQADGGIARPDRTHAALVRSIRARGGEIRDRTPVQAVRPEHGGVRVETAAETFSAGAVVVAAGAWAAQLLAPLGVDLPVRVTRETVVHFRLAEPNGLPTVIDRTPAKDGSNREAYALPSPGIGLKAGVHRAGRPDDPQGEGSPDDAVAAEATAWARERYELADPEPVLVETCLYTTTPDERFVVQRHDRVVVCSACSGHGFKFTPETGRRTAALAEAALAH